MSHPHGKSVSQTATSHKSQILFMPSLGPLASLVTTVGKRKKHKPMQFADPHAALDWAIAHKAGFVYFQGERLEQN